MSRTAEPINNTGVRADWHRLVTRLKDRGIHSPNVERLRHHLSTEEQHEQLETEMRSEIARALGRAEAKVLAALVALELADDDVKLAGDDAVRRSEALEAREQRRREALEARTDYKIHREAVGIRRNAQLDQLFPVPPPRRG